MLQTAPSAVTVAAVGAVLATTGFALLPLAKHIGDLVVPERRVFFARWGGRHLVLAVVALLLSGMVAHRLTPMLVGAEPDLVGILSMLALSMLPPAAVVWFSAKRTEPNWVVSLGLQREKSVAAVLYALGLYVLFLPALFGAGLFWPWLYERLGGVPEAQQVLLGFADLAGGRLAVACLLATLVVPFFEELLFRGFLQPFLVQNFHDRGGVILTSLIFAALHGGAAFGPIFVLSLLLGGVALRTRRLWASWAVHAVHNGAMIAVFLHRPDLVGPPGGLLGILGLTS
ncbi:MAG: CPBP family intramembrane metalloprotease [Planctomycetes bacterium]|nr:CPBP family intramembrane metalloprotease [Planctomycetota bacterium]MCB9905851.1 CPBP family intramembrane metalloprotease [Planctomycetota bacterium]